MLKIIGITATAWTMLSVLFVVFIWPNVVPPQRDKTSRRAPEDDSKTTPLS